MDLLQTIIIAIVEGLTEFLPVSSTGHMIITQNLLGVQAGDPFVHAFTFIIQFGAILSVVCLYWRHFFQMRNREELAANEDYLLQVLHAGNDKANQVASETLDNVRKAMKMDY